MSTDSTELTFVRCPSCRSLVPAISTRCRMCGSSLDASASAGETDDSPKSGRVRQRTMSKPDEALGRAVSEIRDNADDEAPAFSKSEVQPDEGVATDSHDPLGDYVEEMVSTEESTEGVVDEPVSEMKAPEVPVAAVNVRQAQSSPPKEDPPRQHMDKGQQQVVVESGMRPKNKGSGLSFGGGKPQEKPQQPQQPKQSDNRDAKSQPSKETKPDERHSQTRHDDHKSHDERQKDRQKQQEKQPQQPEAKVQRTEPRTTPTPSVEQPAQLREVKRTETQSDTPGRLFGWLVNYLDPTGTSIELREGKYFVTSKSLKSSDLVLDDPSISTPHAVLKIGADTGFEIQDLMSERGVFIRERESDVYRKIEDRERIKHGDWVRFGDMEFLVSLVAHVGKK